MQAAKSADSRARSSRSEQGMARSSTLTLGRGQLSVAPWSRSAPVATERIEEACLTPRDRKRTQRSTAPHGDGPGVATHDVARAFIDYTEVDVEPMLGCNKGAHQLLRPALPPEFRLDHQVASDGETTPAPLEPHRHRYVNDAADHTILALEDEDVSRTLRRLSVAPPPRSYRHRMLGKHRSRHLDERVLVSEPIAPDVRHVRNGFTVDR